MKIDRIELYHVQMPLVTPWRTAYGDDAAVESVLCRMCSGSLDAWGESSPLAAPCYSPEWAGGVFDTCRQWLAPALLGQDVTSGEQLQQLLSHFKGNPFAKAALDTAWWNLAALAADTPLGRFIGASRDVVAVGADFGVADDVEHLLDEMRVAVDAGFPRVKLKFRPGWDLPMLTRVRETFPDTVIHIDCNSGYTLDDLDMFRQVDELHLAMIEQPLGFDDVHHHARLQQAIRTPVCLDESANSVARVKLALELQSCRYVNIKPGRVGGLTNAIGMHDLCRDAGIPCWVGGMLESAVGVEICAALAMLDNFTYPADIFPSEKYFAEELGLEPIVLTTDTKGQPAVATPTHATRPCPERLQRMTVQQAIID